jgi:hypothetical protein
MRTVREPTTPVDRHREDAGRGGLERPRRGLFTAGILSEIGVA